MGVKNFLIIYHICICISRKAPVFWLDSFLGFGPILLRREGGKGVLKSECLGVHFEKVVGRERSILDLRVTLKSKVKSWNINISSEKPNWNTN